LRALLIGCADLAKSTPGASNWVDVEGSSAGIQRDLSVAVEAVDGSGKAAQFSAFYQSSQVFTSIADVSDPDYLEPWIQWYSIHTGLAYDEHKVFYLTDGPKADHPDIWRILDGLGKSVMNCGSMNARALAGSNVFYLPDPWCSNEPAWPSEIEVFKTVMAKLIQESTRGVALIVNELLPFVTFLIGHGLTPDTIRAILAQLGSERLSQTDVKWRRVALADRLQFDLFRHYYRRMRPDFATFFINSTAHLQHAYWRYMDPEAFALKPEKDEIKFLQGTLGGTLPGALDPYYTLSIIRLRPRCITAISQ
jgi:hypothetical protein